MSVTAYFPAAQGFLGHFVIPSAFVTEAEVATWLAAEMEGTALQVRLDIENPLDIGCHAGAFKLIQLARQAGVLVKSDITEQEKPWDFSCQHIGRYTDLSVYEPINLVFIPQVREAINNAGYDGIKSIECFENHGREVWMPMRSSQIKPIT